MFPKALTDGGIVFLYKNVFKSGFVIDACTFARFCIEMVCARLKSFVLRQSVVKILKSTFALAHLYTVITRKEQIRISGYDRRRNLFVGGSLVHTGATTGVVRAAAHMLRMGVVATPFLKEKGSCNRLAPPRMLLISHTSICESFYYTILDVACHIVVVAAECFASVFAIEDMSLHRVRRWKNWLFC